MRVHQRLAKLPWIPAFAGMTQGNKDDGADWIDKAGYLPAFRSLAMGSSSPRLRA